MLYKKQKTKNKLQMMKPVLLSSMRNYVLEIYLIRKSFDVNELERQKYT